MAMHDTEPMPAFTQPQAGTPPSLRIRYPISRSIAASFSAGFVASALLFALTLGLWTHTQFSALRAEVRASRVAAEGATRAAERATLAAQAAQSAVASNDPQPSETPEPDTTDVSP